MDVPTNPVDRYVYFRRLAQHIRAKRDMAYTYGQYTAASDLYNEAQRYQQYNQLTAQDFHDACSEFSGKDYQKWEKEEGRQRREPPQQVALRFNEQQRKESTGSKSSGGVWTVFLRLWQRWKRP